MSEQLTAAAKAWPTSSSTEIFHGVEVSDPYRWLEVPDSPETRDFLEYQREKTRSYLDASAQREIIRDRVQEMLNVEEVRNLYRVAGRYFFTKLLPDREQPVIAMRRSDCDQDEIIVDPADRNQGPAVSVDILRVSEKGRLVAYTVRQGGEDEVSIEIFDVENRRVLADRLPKGKPHGFAFSPDGATIFYQMRESGPPKSFSLAAYRHKLGDSLANDECLFQIAENARTRFALSVSRDARFAAYYVREMHLNQKVRSHFLQDLATLEVVKLSSPEEGPKFKAAFCGNRLISAVKHQDGRTDCFEMNPVSLSRPIWTPLFVDLAGRSTSIVVSADYIFIPRVHDFASRIDILNNTGTDEGCIPLPSRGSAEVYSSDPDGSEVTVRFESFFQPPTLYTYSAVTRELLEFAQTQPPFDGSRFKQTDVSYPSKDGTEIHMFVVGCKDLSDSSPAPTILTGYGGFGTSMTPRFSVFVNLLLEQGCRFAMPNIRGGSELGRPWHQAAQRRNRQNAFDDFIASAEWLIEHKWTTADQLAIFGGSNAGLLVGAAMTQRPDLFKAVLCIAPLLDMLRYDQFDRAHKWIDEYGIASDADDFAVLRAYSPYHRVAEGVRYPATLFVSGDMDTRCNPMHARKMVARLQQATSSDAPILLDYSSVRGHAPAMSAKMRLEAVTDRLAFVCRQLGITWVPSAGRK